MRVVLDTNVLVSAALKRNSTPSLAVHLVELHDELLKSGATERQLFDVIDRPYLASLIDAKTRDWLRRLMALAEPVGIVERVTACRDPTDDKFLELAHNGRADVVVTGDSDLLLLDPFRDIRIMNPAEFLRLIR